MKITWFLLAAFAVAHAAVIPQEDYLPPSEEVTDASLDVSSFELADDGYRYKTIRKLKYRHRRDVSDLVAPEYLPPAEEVADLKEAEVTEAPEESAVLADDGYRYKTVRRLKYRKRRDVSELVAPEYLPSAEEVADLKEAEVTEAPEESAVLADDGYRYKTVRRLKYRKRRDVSELVAPEYLPPADEVADLKEAEVTEAPEESAVLADDGYRYKTVRRLKYRKRRDVSELIAPEYLPPAEEVADLKGAEVTEAPEESAVLADDGYRYKTVRRLKYRKRRDVSELVAPEYLPPADEVADLKEAEVTEAPEESAVLADDGYRYKTVRRLKYRKRRDVSELVAPEYLSPAKEVAALKEAEVTEAPEESAVLADDGYRYKTVRRLKYRKRRDVSELVAPEYLPPAEEVADLKEAEVTEAPEESAVLADNGYRYKTVRRLKYRKRRDVSELVAPEYLPPAEEVADLKEAEVTEAPEESAVLADDGYRYKTVRRLKYRKRRDVSELVAPEYLPSAEEVADLKEAEVTEAPEESAVLADDGYRYKTVRKLKYRKRRDVSELVAPEYLPPAEEVADLKEAEVTETPEESAVLADDGYRYKTVRRLKYRKRRDVSELVAPEYLPPAEEVADLKEAEVTEVPEESAVLADDGYRYKTVRRLKYRKRRDVSELVAPEYLPPAEEVADLKEAEVTEAPEESAVLADNGYRYKTVRRLKYRKRRDVSELVAPEYLPPAEEVADLKEAEVTEAPEESAVLADDGYRYKTVRRLKYRKRRDVSELVAPEYLPSAEEVADLKEAEVIEAPEESAVLADDGYRYKTVRKLKYRKRRDVSELVAPEYLPPAEEVADLKEAEVTETPEESAVLADDGYRYKTVRRLKYRKRRDVSELVAPEYLPPAEEVADLKEAEVTEVPEESAVLADDGYRYKTVRRLKYRKRRDVSELVAPEYIPPVEEQADVKEGSAVLADDGYRYKTVKRFRH